MTNEDELRDYLELVAAHLRRTRRRLREVEERYAGPIAIVGMGTCGPRPARAGGDAAGPWPSGAVLPALTTWRRGDRDEPVTADWRYRVTWMPAADPGPAALSGTWLLVAPRGEPFRDMVTQCAAAMAARGARVDTMLVDCAAVSWDVLAGLLEGALAGESLTGVVSFLGLNEAPLPARPAVPAGLAGTAALVQALGGAGVAAPLWMLIRDAAAGDLARPDRRGGREGLPAESGARAAALLCTVLVGWETGAAAVGRPGRRPGRRRRAPWPADAARPAGAWSADADRECLQAVNEAAGAPAQR